MVEFVGNWEQRIHDFQEDIKANGFVNTQGDVCIKDETMLEKVFEIACKNQVFIIIHS